MLVIRENCPIGHIHRNLPSIFNFHETMISNSSKRIFASYNFLQDTVALWSHGHLDFSRLLVQWKLLSI
uniref:Uncharacterized protein n=1 Tax=Rhizophora mucronata TaxID=61149 RepID=A0A2P2NQZ2_RHIMU